MFIDEKALKILSDSFKSYVLSKLPPEPITDLTGYTWVGNSSITATAGYGGFNINYNDGYNNSYSTLYVGYNWPSRPPYTEPIATADGLVSGNLTAFAQNGSFDTSYNPFTFTGGTDATNATLIAWLEANGTLTAPQPAITDLTGTTWEFNELFYINEDTDEYYNVNFVSNSQNYSDIYILRTTFQLPNDDWEINIMLSYDGISVYDYVGSQSYSNWSNDNYRTITITGGTDATNQDLIDWLQENATQII